MASGEDCCEFISVELLQKNPPDVFLDVSELLVRFADNIIRDPENEKYRKIRVANPIVQKRLLPVEGAMECIFEMGFEEDGEYFILPTNSSLDDLKGIRKYLQEHRRKIQSTRTSAKKETAVSSEVLPSSSNTEGAVGGSTKLPSPYIPIAFMIPEANFFKKLESSHNHVQIYENTGLQKAALACIPAKQLLDLATEKQHQLAEQSGNKPHIRDVLLLELLAWFKVDFFKWVNAPPCDSCNGQTSSVGMAQPTDEELRYGAGRVEHYRCNTCGTYTRFPRYNHPGKLLETRQGRCGEWANCFTLCCRAMGFEARYVLDWTDHVWTEVYSVGQRRWLHCDPCENTCDKPLLYEAGWGKPLTYVIAFSKDDIQDVTWRYSAKHQEVLARRTECRELWLLKVLTRLRKKKQASLSEMRKKELQDRMVVEICEFLTVKSAQDGELIGRQSGSTAWRQARGEIGTSPASTPNQPSHTVIKPSASEIAECCLWLQYNCARDCYMREYSAKSKLYGWQSLVYESTDLARKEELDWNMVYLARTEGSNRASVTWKVDLSDSGCKVGNIEVLSLDTACYEDGQILWTVCAGDTCVRVQPDTTPVVLQDLAGSDYLSITAELRRGKGDVAWQHTQLFRQGLRDYQHQPLSIKIHLQKKV